MQEIRLEKLVLNIGIGQSEEKLESAKSLLKKLTGQESAYTKAKKRMPEFGIRKGQMIGAVVTLRGREAVRLPEERTGREQQRDLSELDSQQLGKFRDKGVHILQRSEIRPEDRNARAQRERAFLKEGAMRVESRKRKRSRVAEPPQEDQKGGAASRTWRRTSARRLLRMR